MGSDNSQTCNYRPVLLERNSLTGPAYRQRQGGPERLKVVGGHTAQWGFIRPPEMRGILALSREENPLLGMKGPIL